jgi:membrane protease subunit HflK
MAGNNGGPWGGGGNRGNGGDDRGSNNGGGNNGGGGDGRKPGGDGPQIPEIDELMKKGQEQLRVLMGGRGGGGANGTGGGDMGGGISRGTIGLAALGAVALWLFTSFYSVKPEEQSVELFLGEYSSTGNPGLNFAPWPFVTAEILPVTREQTEDIGTGGRDDSGLMLTTDENIVDIDFQVVWNINDPAKFLFNLADPRETIRAVAESAMREIIARSELAPILNRDRQAIADSAQELIQSTMDSYNSGVTIVRLNLDKADPKLSTASVKCRQQNKNVTGFNAKRTPMRTKFSRVHVVKRPNSLKKPKHTALSKLTVPKVKPRVSQPFLRNTKKHLT